MAEKFSILNSINLSKLNKEIDEHRCAYLNDPYIFMNYQTYDEIAKSFKDQSNSQKFMDYNHYRRIGFTAQYQGCKVFSDPTLEYGEVELR